MFLKLLVVESSRRSFLNLGLEYGCLKCYFPMGFCDVFLREKGDAGVIRYSFSQSINMKFDIWE